MLKYILIPLAVALVFFLIHAVRSIRSRMAASKIERMRLFEHIGREWTGKIAEAIGEEIISRRVFRQIQSRFYKKQRSWLIAIPLRDYSEGIDLELIVGIGPLIPAPEPHIKTLLMDMIIVTDKKRRWWASNCNTKIFEDTVSQLSGEGLIFPIAHTNIII